MENQRVRLANKIYKLAIHVLVAGFGCGALASLENPSRSWLWAVLALLVKEMFPDPLHPFRQWFFNLEDCDFDMCMHGGERPKTTRLKASPGVFTALADRCDGKHSHKPWTVQKRDGTWTFDTAAEAEYPAQLAKRMVQCAVRKVPDSCLSFTYKHFRLHALQSIGKQHRQHRQLIAEFATILKLPTPPHNVEYKLLDSFDPQFSGEQDQDQKGMVDGLKKFGVYHTPLQHVQLAMNLQHPASISTIVPDVLRMNLFTILTCGMSHMAKRRADILRKVMDMKRQLAESEAALRAKMDPNVSAVTSNKPLALWRSLLVESGFPDAEVVSDHMELGVDLVGLEPESRLYDVKYKPLMMTPEQLSGQAMWRRKAVIGQQATADEKEQADQLSEESLKEVERGFLAGPYSTEDEVSRVLGTSEWSLNKRFVLLQGEEQKPRIIDNCRDSGVNEAYGSASYLALHDTDYVAAFLQFISLVLANRESVVVPLTNGDVLRGSWHGEFSECPKLLGRCVDLSKAYKQIAVAPTSRKFAVLGHRTQCGGWAFYISNSLPFGASSSVFAFNKVSRGLWHLLTHQMGCLTTVFFDDFPMFEFEPLQRVTTTAVSTLFDLLGWLHATTGKKAAPFDQVVTALGVRFSLSDLWSGKLTVANKSERLERMQRMFGRFLIDKTAKKADCASLHGMLNFACGFVLGNSLKPLARAVADMAVQSAKWSALHETCLLAEMLLPNVKPRVLTLPSPDCRFILYTDGAFENGNATWGAVLWDKRCLRPRVYWGAVPKRLLDFWLEHAGEQVICEVELYAHLLVRWRCMLEFGGELGLCFIDNEASRFSLVKSSSPSVCMRVMVYLLSLIETVHPFSAWHERVPSQSNPADMPSRGQGQQCCELFNGAPLGDIFLPEVVLDFLTTVKFDSTAARTICASLLDMPPGTF